MNTTAPQVLQRRERVAPVALPSFMTPEFLRRQAVARDFNAQLAARRLLDRETYRGLRKFIRIPVNATERERNARWAVLTNTLHLRQSYPTLRPGIGLLRAMRAEGAK